MTISAEGLAASDGLTDPQPSDVLVFGMRRERSAVTQIASRAVQVVGIPPDGPSLDRDALQPEAAG